MSDHTQSRTEGEPRRIQRWQIAITGGASRGATVEVDAGTVQVGSASSNQIVIDDPRVSRRHLEIKIDPDGPLVRDLDSKNGTRYAGSYIHQIVIPLAGGVLALGNSEITIRPVDAHAARPEPPVRDRLCRMVGASMAMRELYHHIERVAETNLPVLVQGETGTGKELIAEALHTLGRRRDRPFVVVDCSTTSRSLIESHLFGHVRGAFTGAIRDVPGAFAEADTGTVFLDEIGELALDLQPKLLRVLESGGLRPVGGTTEIEVDVRVIAATHRDLGEEVAAGRFRRDLYYRLSVVPVTSPPLRQRMEDLPMLADAFLQELGSPPLSAEGLAELGRSPWPGNVRQLRNVLYAAAMKAGDGASINPEDLAASESPAAPSAVLGGPYKKAKDGVVTEFTREYLEALFERHRGNAAAAAREAELDRDWLVALARKCGVRVRQ